MNTDARVAITFRTHPKRKRLQRELGHAGPLALVDLWLWAAAHRPTGDLSGLLREEIADAANWPERRADRLVDALLATGFLDEDAAGSLALHDWKEHNAYALRAPIRAERARKGAEAKWARRDAALDAHSNATSTATSNAGSSDIADAPSPSPSPYPSPVPSPSPSPSPKTEGKAVPPTPHSTPPVENPTTRPRKPQGTAGEGFRSLSETGNGTAGNSEFSIGLASLVRCDKALKSVCATLEARGAGTLRDELMQQVLPLGIDQATNEPRLSVPPDLHGRITGFLAAQDDLTGMQRIFRDWFLPTAQETTR